MLRSKWHSKMPRFSTIRIKKTKPINMSTSYSTGWVFCSSIHSRLIGYFVQKHCKQVPMFYHIIHHRLENHPYQNCVELSLIWRLSIHEVDLLNLKSFFYPLNPTLASSLQVCTQSVIIYTEGLWLVNLAVTESSSSVKVRNEPKQGCSIDEP